MSLIAIYSMKGGVGKTTSSVNIAYLSSQNDYYTLLCDMDPQGSTSFYYRIQAKTGSGKKGFTHKNANIDDDIKGSDFDNLDVLPSDFSYRKFDIALHEKKKAPHNFRKKFNRMVKEYDHIFLDCPPNLTLYIENILLSADYIIIPVIPTTLSQRTLETVYRYMQKNRIDMHRVIPFFSMVNARTRLHRETMASMRQQYPEFASTFIPELAEIEKMGTYRQPVPHRHPGSRAAREYKKLFKEIKERISKKLTP